MQRYNLIPAFLALAVCAAALMPGGTQQAQAQYAPWCANYVSSNFDIHECIYRSIEECRPNVIAGNRGYCAPNPRAPDTLAPRRHRKRHG